MLSLSASIFNSKNCIECIVMKAYLIHFSRMRGRYLEKYSINCCAQRIILNARLSITSSVPRISPSAAGRGQAFITPVGNNQRAPSMLGTGRRPRTRVYVRVREIEPVDRTASSSADRARIEGREKKRAGRTRGQHTSVVSRVVYHGSRFHGQDHWNNGWIHASPSSFSSSSSYSCSTAPPIRSYRN